jgi:hygromycin-B 7''-O-kinase
MAFVMSVPPPPAFPDDDAYERSLTDAGFWAPYAKAALRLSGLPDEGEVHTRFPTTHVAALVNGAYLVKLHYEDWFGEDCFQTEREAYTLLSRADLPIPELLAEGALYDDGWRWPFLVMTAMHGRALRELDGEVTPQDAQRIARWIGHTLRELHAVPTKDGERISHEIYVDLIQIRQQRCHRDHEQWGSLPPHLQPLVRDYVWQARKLIDPEREKPVFLHGDLHAGNVFVDGEPGALGPTGIVDFNDAYEGDPHYDLVAIHMRAFGGDKRLLRTMLDGYGWDELGKGWPRRMTALTLAHDYDMIQPIADRYPDRLDEITSLDDLAGILWDLDAPGLT